MVVSLASANFWVGGFRLSSSGGSKPWTGQWKWSDESPFNYYNWSDGEPNNVNVVDFNIMVYPDGTRKGKWNDDMGSTPRPFVCEYKLRYIHL